MNKDIIKEEMFRKLFGAKEKSIEIPKKLNKPNHNETGIGLSEHIEKSTIQIMSHQLFMHHRKLNLIENKNDPSWKNQTIYFWNANEKFEKKSLPAEFKEYEKHYFIINQLPKEIQLNKGKAIPWFGMEGNGDKFFFSNNGSEIQLENLSKKNIIQYVQIIKLNTRNIHLLTNRKNCYWLMDSEIINYANNSFQFNGDPISISQAYRIGGLRLIKIN